jgi:hypothetical protein
MPLEQVDLDAAASQQKGECRTGWSRAYNHDTSYRHNITPLSATVCSFASDICYLQSDIRRTVQRAGAWRQHRTTAAYGFASFYPQMVTFHVRRC